MPTLSFSLSSFTNKNTDMKAGATFCAYASGTGVASAVVTAGRLTLNSIKIYSSQCYLEIVKTPGVCQTATYAQNFSVHNVTKNFSSITNGMAQAGNGTITFTIRASGGSTANMINLRDDVSGTLELDYFVPVSTCTVSRSEIILNKDEIVNLDVTVTPAHSSAFHYLTVKFQTSFKTYELNDYDTTERTAPFVKTFAIPHTWLDAIPNSESDIIFVTLQTYIGGVVTGTDIKQVGIRAHTDLKPIITGFDALRVRGTEPATWGVCVQGFSRVRMSATSVAGVYASTITEVTMSGADNKSVGLTPASLVYETGTINATGLIPWTCTVRDSRGRTQTVVITPLEFFPYSKPKIKSLTAFRCDPNGAANSSGTSVSAMVDYEYSPVGNQNAIVGMVTQYRLYTSPHDTYITPDLDTDVHVKNTAYVVGAGAFDANTSYVVRVTVQDGITSSESTVVVPTQTWLLHYRSGGKGVAIGKVAETENAFEINPQWDMYYKGQKLEEMFAGAMFPVPWAVDKGGTGLNSVTAGSYLKGNGTGALVPTSPAQVLADIGGAAAGHSHTLDSLSGTLSVTKGGTGGTTAAAARENLGITPLNINAVAKKLYASEAALNAETQDSFYRRTDFTQIGFTGVWDSYYKLQLLHNFNTNNLYFRHSVDGVWNPSRRLFHDGDTIGIINGGTGGTTAAAARSNLGITPANLKVDWKTVYNYTEGCLVETSLSTSESNMFLLEIKGNGYGQSRVIDIDMQGYYFQPGDYFVHLKAVARDLVISIRVFKYNGKVYFWFKQPSEYMTFWVYLRAWNSTENKITAITWAAMPTSGVTLDNTVVPAQVFNSSEGNIVPIANGGTGASTAANACANIGAVKKSGDSMTGALTIDINGIYVSLGSGGYGYAHYFTNGVNGHWFNTTLRVQGDIYAGPSYDKRVFHAGDTIPIANGGTGAVSKASAKFNLGIRAGIDDPTAWTEAVDGDIYLKYAY